MNTSIDCDRRVESEGLQADLVGGGHWSQKQRVVDSLGFEEAEQAV